MGPPVLGFLRTLAAKPRPPDWSATRSLPPSKSIAWDWSLQPGASPTRGDVRQSPLTLSPGSGGRWRSVYERAALLRRPCVAGADRERVRLENRGNAHGRLAAVVRL